MENKFNYSFDDEVVSKFCYDIDKKKIITYFTGYTDLIEQKRFLDRQCIFTIENWEKAKSKVGDENRFFDLDKNMGIFSMILYVKLEEGGLEILVNTLDDRYITLIFTNVDINFRIL
ncbi:hypothetical protein [Apibacter adventoris]|uniref:Uncharacterized protein n=1 Tax=Apibacter adventoris TaxID=1679466 RepID=A0A2S8AFH4_9FLAO|nr:hypothetical protein [Apibacter adventoris]PQL94858.1 hypothetical protein C4S77_02425 [Apibacter adventoris]